MFSNNKIIYNLSVNGLLSAFYTNLNVFKEKAKGVAYEPVAIFAATKSFYFFRMILGLSLISSISFISWVFLFSDSVKYSMEITFSYSMIFVSVVASIVYSLYTFFFYKSYDNYSSFQDGVIDSVIEDMNLAKTSSSDFTVDTYKSVISDLEKDYLDNRMTAIVSEIFYCFKILKTKDYASGKIHKKGLFGNVMSSITNSSSFSNKPIPIDILHNIYGMKVEFFHKLCFDLSLAFLFKDVSASKNKEIRSAINIANEDFFQIIKGFFDFYAKYIESDNIKRAITVNFNDIFHDFDRVLYGINNWIETNESLMNHDNETLILATTNSVYSCFLQVLNICAEERDDTAIIDIKSKKDYILSKLSGS
jgi:hypothetical protein